MLSLHVPTVLNIFFKNSGTIYVAIVTQEYIFE